MQNYQQELSKRRRRFETAVGEEGIGTQKCERRERVIFTKCIGTILPRMVVRTPTRSQREVATEKALKKHDRGRSAHRFVVKFFFSEIRVSARVL